MSKYDLADVKSVQKFLLKQKEVYDAVNAQLPEDAKKLDYDSFTDDFYKANDGILKNRDALKQEKLTLSEEFEAFKANTDEKISSIDEKHKNDYNALVKERDELKTVLKDGNVDIDGINAKHEAAMANLKAEYDGMLTSKTKELTEANEGLTKETTKFKDMFFTKLRKEALSEQLDRVGVNPEDRALIIQANLSRAEIAEDKNGNYKVDFRVDNETTVDGTKFWDSWAADNQRYLKASDNSGGGAVGGANAQPADAKAQVIQKLQDPNTPLNEWMRLNDQLKSTE
jgi:hypothetical protein